MGVGVGQVGGLEVFIAEVVEDGFGGGELFAGEGAEVEDGEERDQLAGHYAAATLLATGIPPIAQQPQCTVRPYGECAIKCPVGKGQVRPCSSTNGWSIGEGDRQRLRVQTEISVDVDAAGGVPEFGGSRFHSRFHAEL